jgi:hypothetical protein
VGERERKRDGEKERERERKRERDRKKEKKRNRERFIDEDLPITFFPLLLSFGSCNQLYSDPK